MDQGRRLDLGLQAFGCENTKHSKINKMTIKKLLGGGHRY